jgi:hypothetical protein
MSRTVPPLAYEPRCQGRRVLGGETACERWLDRAREIEALTVGGSGPHPVESIGGARAWAVWTAWRGEPRLFVHLVLSAASAVGTSTQHADCLIESCLDDDAESFSSPEDWLDHATVAATNRFNSLHVQTSGAHGRLVIHMAYMPNKTLQKAPAILVTADAATPSAAGSLLSAVTPALRRGGFRWSRDPFTNQTGKHWSDVVNDRVSHRFRMLEIPYALFVLGVALASAILLPARDSSALGPVLHYAVLVVTGTACLVLVVMAIALVFGWDRYAWFARLRRSLHRAVFPAIDIAARRPGRRLFGLLLASVGPVAVPVAKVLLGIG